MRHDDFDDGTLLHAVARYCKVQQEGAPEHYFIDASQDTVEDGTPVIAEEGNEIGMPIPTILNDEDVSNFRELWDFVSMMTTNRHRKIYQHQMPIIMNALTWNGIPFQLMTGEWWRW